MVSCDKAVTSFSSRPFKIIKYIGENMKEVMIKAQKTVRGAINILIRRRGLAVWCINLHKKNARMMNGMNIGFWKLMRILMRLFGKATFHLLSVIFCGCTYITYTYFIVHREVRRILERGLALGDTVWYRWKNIYI